MNHNDTIIALATPSGVGAIGVIRISGKDSIEMQSCTQCHPTCVPQGAPT